MSASVGYGRLGWNVGAWNESPDAAAVITGQQILSSVNFGKSLFLNATFLQGQ